MLMTLRYISPFTSVTPVRWTTSTCASLIEIIRWRFLFSLQLNARINLKLLLKSPDSFQNHIPSHLGPVSSSITYSCRNLGTTFDYRLTTDNRMNSVAQSSFIHPRKGQKKRNQAFFLSTKNLLMHLFQPRLPHRFFFFHASLNKISTGLLKQDF